MISGGDDFLPGKSNPKNKKEGSKKKGAPPQEVEKRGHARKKSCEVKKQEDLQIKKKSGGALREGYPGVAIYSDRRTQGAEARYRMGGGRQDWYATTVERGKRDGEGEGTLVFWRKGWSSNTLQQQHVSGESPSRKIPTEEKESSTPETRIENCLGKLPQGERETFPSQQVKREPSIL